MIYNNRIKHTTHKMSKEIHYEFWLLMIPYYCKKWLNGVDYDELMKEYKLNQNKDER